MDNINITNKEIMEAVTRGSSSYFSTSNRYIVFWIECIKRTQNTVDNYTDVTVKVWVKRTNSGYETYGTGTTYLKVNGSSYSKAITSGDKITSTPRNLISKDVRVYHNEDGSKLLNMSASISHSQFSTGTGYYDEWLPAIPRVSDFTISKNDFNLGESTISIDIKKSSSAFTHKVYYRFGNINTLLYNGANVKVDHRPSIQDCSQIPNSLTGTGDYMVETWNGNTKIGYKVKQFTARVPASVKPSLNSLKADIVYNGIDPKFGYVQSKTSCKLSISGPAGSYGSSITNYSISGGGFASNNASFVTPVIYTSGIVVFTAYVVDSRGRKSDIKEVSIDVNPYASPRILEFSVRRCLIDGSVNEDGTYANVSTKFIHTDIYGGNPLVATLDYRKVGDPNWIPESTKPKPDGSVAIGGGKFDNAYTYEIRLSLRDSFSDVTQIVSLGSSFVTVDFRKGGKGIAVGKASEKDGLFDIKMDVDVKGKFTVNGKPVETDTSHLLPKSKVNGLDGQSPNKVYGKVPYVQPDGVLEVGKYIDFHATDNAGDYDVRVIASSNLLQTGGQTTLQTGYLQANKEVKIVDTARNTTFKMGINDTECFINNSKKTSSIQLKNDGNIWMPIQGLKQALIIGMAEWSEISIMPSITNFGNIGTNRYVWDTLKCTNQYSLASLENTRSHNVTSYTDKEYLYNTFKDINLYMLNTVSMQYDEEIIDSDGNKTTVPLETPIRTEKQKVKLTCNAEELPFMIAPKNDLEGTGNESIELGAMVSGLSGAFSYACEKIETLENKIDSLEQRLMALEQLIPTP